MRTQVVVAVISVLVVVTILYLVFRLPAFNDQTPVTSKVRVVNPATLSNQDEIENMEDSDFTAYPTRNCTLCRLQGLQCCYNDGRESCLGPEFHCAQRAKQSCHTRNCPRLGQNRSLHTPPHNRLCFFTSLHYYYCRGQNCAGTRKCADGSPMARAFIRPSPVVQATMLRDTLAVAGAVSSVSLLVYLYKYHQRQPLKSRNVWILVGDVLCSFLWFTSILFNNVCPCLLYITTVVFCTLYLSLGKICRMAHVIVAHRVETRKKEIEQVVFSELAKSVKTQKQNDTYIIHYNDEDAIEETLEKIYNSGWYLSYPMLIAPAALATFFTFLYVFTAALILGGDLVTSAESCIEHKSVGLVALLVMTISMVSYFALVCYARTYCSNTIIPYTREFAMDTAIFVCLSLLVSLSYIFGAIAAGPSKGSILSVSMLSPFISLINVTLMLGNSVGLPVLESYNISKYDAPVTNGATVTDTSGRMRRTIGIEEKRATELSRLSQALRGTLSQDLLKNYAAYEYATEYVMLWRLIDTYRNHRNTLRLVQRKQLLKYLYYIFKGSNYALPVKIPTDMIKPELSRKVLYDIQMEVLELHLLPLYLRMVKLHRFNEQLTTLGELGALPNLEAYDVCPTEEPVKKQANEEGESYSSEEEEEDEGIVNAQPGRHLDMPHLASSEEERPSRLQLHL